MKTTPMKSVSYLVSAFALSFVLFVAFINNASAVELPKGLEDRGPLEKRTFIHYRRANAKPDGVGKKPSGGTSLCYSTFGKGIMWKDETIEYVINATNSGMTQQELEDVTLASVNTWDSQTGFNLNGAISFDNTANWDDSSPDYTNEISFGPYGTSNTIAVTNTWGYFGGPPQTREIIEFDILFNTNSYEFSTNLAANTMDFQNILTHELGHGYGLKDIYDTSCDTVTMYGYSEFNETSKSDLEQADIDGIRSIYGN